MKKIPTLFTRIYEGHKIVGIRDEITPGCEDAFKNGIVFWLNGEPICKIKRSDFGYEWPVKDS